jgi:hypothetical protein
MEYPLVYGYILHTLYIYYIRVWVLKQFHPVSIPVTIPVPFGILLLAGTGGLAMVFDASYASMPSGAAIAWNELLQAVWRNESHKLS